MSQVYKTLKPGEKKVTPFVAHKRWNINHAETGSWGVKVLTGTYQSGVFNPSDPLEGNANTEATNNDGSYKKLVFDSVAHLYYDGADNPWDVFDNDTPHKTIREIHGDVQIISIPNKIIGEKIKPGSVKITSGSTILKDDEWGNLIDTTDLTGSRCSGSQDHVNFYLGFWDGYRKDPALTHTLDLQYEGKYYQTPKAFEVKFDQSLYGRGCTFHGTQSFFRGEPNVKAHDNSIIEVENSQIKENHIFDDDFTIAFWVNAPKSQSVTESYSSAFTGNDTWQTRDLKASDTNTIACKHEWWGNHWPFMFEMINHNNATHNGKLKFLRRSKSADGYSQILTGKISETGWNHIALVKTGSDLKLYHNGILSQSVTDQAHNLTTYNPGKRLTIGARRYHWKAKYWHNERAKWVHDFHYKNYIKPFSGSLDEFRIFDKGLDANEIRDLSASLNNTNRVGNVMYNHGMITITTPSQSGYQHYHDLSPFDLEFKGTHKVKEHLYICNSLNGEFNMTYNPSTRVNHDLRNDNMQAWTTHSEFNPYITSVGLYDDNSNLVAVGKLAQPVKNPEDYDLTIQVRFDTTI